jgi:TAP-like protein
VSAYSQAYRACLEWPRPMRRAPLVPRRATPLPASIPVLIVGGDLDSLTPLADAEQFGPTLGAAVRVVRLPNTTHVSSEGYTELLLGTRCARRIIRAFVRAPGKLQSLDTRCAERIPPVHTPGSYPVRLADATPATLLSGPDPGLSARRAVTVAAGALADAPVRRFYSGAGRGPGLRGGSFTARGESVVRLRLRRVRFVRDATVDGTGSWRPSDGAVRGTLVVRTAGAEPVRIVRLAWKQRSRRAHAVVGAATLELPAP